MARKYVHHIQSITVYYIDIAVVKVDYLSLYIARQNGN